MFEVANVIGEKSDRQVVLVVYALDLIHTLQCVINV